MGIKRNLWLTMSLMIMVLLLVLALAYFCNECAVEKHSPIKILYVVEQGRYNQEKYADMVLTYGDTYVPMLIREANWDFATKGKPLHERSIDVLYRSSNCVSSRDDLALLIQDYVEKEGFTYRATGKCGNTDVSPTNDKPDTGLWYGCPECKDAKLIIAFEKVNGTGDEYLTEKPFLPMHYGAIPVYWGTGHDLMNRIGVNMKRIIDRSDYDTHESFAKAIVDLLRDPNRLSKMYDMPLVENPNGLLASDIYKPFTPSLRKSGCNTPIMKRLRDKNTIYISNKAPGIVDIEHWLRDALCISPETQIRSINDDDRNPPIPDVILRDPDSKPWWEWPWR